MLNDTTYLNNQTYTEWLCHTNFSFLAGASHPAEILDRAAAQNLSGICVSDFDGAYGLARTYRHWRDLPKEQRPKLFYGAELHLEPDHDLPITLRNTLAFVVHSLKGYENLGQLITHSHRQSKTNAVLTLDDLKIFPIDGLSALVPMRGLIRRGNRQRWLAQLQTLKEYFADNLYLVISRHFNPAEDCWIPHQIAAAEALEIATLLSQDVFFHSPECKPLSDTLHAIRTNETLEDCVEHMFVNDQRHILSPQDFHKRYRDLPCYDSALRHSAILAQRCQFTFEELKYQYPKEMIPEGHTAQSFLVALSWESAHKVYGAEIPSVARDLLERELSLIATLGFADYFLTVWDIVDWARRQEILCQGRGSAANSAVCFVLGITAVDPTKFDLLFERFMSVERGDPPDIDVDFENERREEVIQYIYTRYGRNKAAMVANVITFRRRGALRSCGKALGIPEAILSQTSEIVSSRIHRGRSLPDIAAEMEAQHPEEPRHKFKLWIELAEALRGFPRHLGIHSGGFMLADRPLNGLVPQEPATMEGRSVVQWCKEDIEALGFFKIDILALGMLTAMRHMFAHLKEHYQITLDMSSIPQNDPNTYQMIQKADTVGTFQIESRAQMSMLPRLRPRTFYDLVIEVAIIRPGPIQGGMIHPFLRRRDGLEPITYPDERLRPILKRTLGIPIFQEQVMRIAMAVGNFTAGEANELRKNMGAWSMKGDISPWLKKLAEGMKMNGLAPEFAESILAQMQGFAEYGFPESHSVSFALIAYASSYLKCHYPDVFFVALLNAQPMGFYSPHALIQTAKRIGITILPVSINHSSWNSTLEKNESSPTFCIRLGLRLIAGFREKSAKKIEHIRRQTGPWQHWEHFLKHVSLHRSELTTLAAADALLPLGIERRAAIWMAAAAPHSSWLEDVEDPLSLAHESDHERIQQDYRATGTSLFLHPAKLFRESLWCYTQNPGKIKLAKDINDLIPNQVITVFGVILILQRPPSANGMMFITLEDETGSMNLVLTPETVKKFASILHGQSMLCVSGKIQRQGLAHSLLIREVYPPQISEADVIPLQPTHKPPSYPAAASAGGYPDKGEFAQSARSFF